jgi:transposase
MDQQGQEPVPRQTIPNNRPGTQALAQQLAELLQSGDFDGLQLAAEATGWYWFHFCLTLSQDPVLNHCPVELYPFNPRLTANFKGTYIDLDHTDVTDSFVVADRLRMGRDLPAPFQYDPLHLPLRFLTRYRYHLVHDLAREKAYCLAILYLKASEYTHPAKRPFSNVFGAASRAVIQEFASIDDGSASLTLTPSLSMSSSPSLMPKATAGSAIRRTMPVGSSRWRATPTRCPRRYRRLSISSSA